MKDAKALALALFTAVIITGALVVGIRTVEYDAGVQYSCTLEQAHVVEIEVGVCRYDGRHGEGSSEAYCRRRSEAQHCTLVRGRT